MSAGHGGVHHTRRCRSGATASLSACARPRVADVGADARPCNWPGGARAEERDARAGRRSR
eukprot:9990480-Alexandrium_andersonii.AAC.1